MITLDSNSIVRINDSLLSRCNMEVITKMFGAGNDSAYYETGPESCRLYPLVLNGQKVTGEFVFTESGQLLRLCIQPGWLEE